mmetsp:Transcript_5368/g.13379  ORF Transcript_5368/g.13379 Transcript_5368/m.13379 type:complete len:415 (-) Transcript_5368:936-2180(-)
MDVLHRQVRQLGQPAADKKALGVDLLARVDRVHHEVPSTDAAVPTHLPHHRIDRHIRVDEGVVVPREPLLPIQVEVLDQELSSDVAEVVAHPAHLPKLAHGRVDKREACLSSLPATELQSRAAPLFVLVLAPYAPRVRIRPAVQLRVSLVSPNDAFGEKPPKLERERLPATRVNVAGREIPKAEVWTQYCGPTLVCAKAASSRVLGVEAGREVATPGGIFQPFLETLHCRMLTDPPETRHLEGPIVLFWVCCPSLQELLPQFVELPEARWDLAPASSAIAQIWKREGPRPSFGWRSQPLRHCRHRVLQATLSPTPLLGLPWLESRDHGLERPGRDAEAFLHKRFELSVAVNVPRLQLPIKEQRRRANIQHHIRDLLYIAASAVNDLTAERPQAVVEVLQRPVAPPKPRASHGPG